MKKHVAVILDGESQMCELEVCAEHLELHIDNDFEGIATTATLVLRSDNPDHIQAATDLYRYLKSFVKRE